MEVLEGLGLDLGFNVLELNFSTMLALCSSLLGMVLDGLVGLREALRI